MVSISLTAPCFRKDAYGTIITKGNKEYKILFIDNV